MIVKAKTSLTNHAPLQGKDLECAIRDAERQTLSLLPRFAHGYKYSHSVDGFYEPPTANVEWTTGFWTGELWLMYELTGNMAFRRAAEWQVEDYGDRIVDMIDVEHHDMGFLYSPSCVASYKLTGNRRARTYALLAADNLVSRFQERGEFIQAWGPAGAPDNYRLIIDCLMNIPLLFWASETTGDEKYRRVALAHFNTSIECVLRPDDSTYHTYYFDPDTGKPLYGVTHQGNRNDSAWSRGQAWGIYGSALAYRYTRSDKALDVFNRTLDFFLEHLPASIIPYWDFDFTDGSDEPRDSSALAVAICGMLEMSDLLDRPGLRKKAEKLLGVLYRECAVKDPAISDGQLLHGVYCRKSPTNDARDRGVDECNTWGDYFYVEALKRVVTPGWKAYW